MTSGGYDPNQYPPPQGGDPYGQPGGYGPPPPPQGYGPGYGAPQGGPAVFSVGNAISYGWEKFKANAGVWVGMVLIVAVIQVALEFALDMIQGIVAPDSWALELGFSMITWIVSSILGATLIKGALDEVSGRKPDISAFFQLPNIGTIVIANFLVLIATAFGFILLIIPGFIVMFLTYWTIPFVIDQNQAPVTAIKSSISAIRTNIGGLLLLALACVGICIAGFVALCVGLLVAIPVATIASVWAYRVTVGGPVAP